MRDDDRVVPIDTRATGLAGIRAIAAGGQAALERLGPGWTHQPADAGRPLDARHARPGRPRSRGDLHGRPQLRRTRAPRRGPERPLIYGKAASAVAGHGATLAWDRARHRQRRRRGASSASSSARRPATSRRPRPLDHVFGYTIVNDVSSRDEWLDGDQWLLGKSMPGFCPVGPVDRHRRRARPRATSRLGCTINGEPIQDGRTSPMRFGDRRDRRLPQPPPRAAARRPDRDRHAGPPRDAARTRPPPAGRRHRDRLDRGDRRAHHAHRLTRDRGDDRCQAADRVPGRDDRPRGRGVPARAPDGHRARPARPSSTARTARC